MHARLRILCTNGEGHSTKFFLASSPSPPLPLKLLFILLFLLFSFLSRCNEAAEHFAFLFFGKKKKQTTNGEHCPQEPRHTWCFWFRFVRDSRCHSFFHCLVKDFSDFRICFFFCFASGKLVVTMIFYELCGFSFVQTAANQRKKIHEGRIFCFFFLFFRDWPAIFFYRSLDASSVCFLFFSLWVTFVNLFIVANLSSEGPDEVALVFLLVAPETDHRKSQVLVDDIQITAHHSHQQNTDNSFPCSPLCLQVFTARTFNWNQKNRKINQIVYGNVEK